MYVNNFFLQISVFQVLIKDGQRWTLGKTWFWPLSRQLLSSFTSCDEEAVVIHSMLYTKSKWGKFVLSFLVGWFPIDKQWNRTEPCCNIWHQQKKSKYRIVFTCIFQLSNVAALSSTARETCDLGTASPDPVSEIIFLLTLNHLHFATQSEVLNTPRKRPFEKYTKRKITNIFFFLPQCSLLSSDTNAII